MPSTQPAKPYTTPDLTAAKVSRPIAASGSLSSTFGSFAVRWWSASSEMSTPGAIAAPSSSPSAETASKLIVVPKSATTQAPPHFSKAATAFASRSVPSSCGRSIRIAIPVFIPGPTTSRSPSR